MSDAEGESFLPKEQEARLEIYESGERSQRSKSRDWFAQILEEKDVSSQKLIRERDEAIVRLQQLFGDSTSELQGRITELVGEIGAVTSAMEEIGSGIKKDNPFDNDLDPRDKDDGTYAFIQFIMKPDEILRPLVTARVLQKVNTKADHVIVTISNSQNPTDSSYAHKICEELGCKHVDLDPKNLETALENCPNCPLEKYLALLGYGFTDYSKVAVLDKSFFPLSNIDDVFKFRSPAAACSELNWFEMKSGILVVKPSEILLGDILTALHDLKRVPDSGFLAEDEDGWGDKDGGTSFLSSWLEYNRTQWARLHPGWSYPWDKIKTGGSWYYFVWRKKALRAVDFQKDTVPWKHVSGNRLGDYESDKYATGRMTASQILKLWWETLIEMIDQHPVVKDVIEESSPRFSKQWFEKALVHNDIGYPDLPSWPLDLADDKHTNWALWNREWGKSG